MNCKQDLKGKAKSLGITVLDGEVFDSSVTHVVSPSERFSLKILTARLAGLWVCNPNWIIDSCLSGASGCNNILLFKNVWNLK
jgi:hypothetical protein